MKNSFKSVLVFALFLVFKTQTVTAIEFKDVVFKAGHPSLQNWILPEVPMPKDNISTKESIALGKALFFDPRLSGDGNMSCATCHSPLLGWSDGLATAKGHNSKVLGRASPVITNAAFNSIQMWDGRKKSLEDQAMGPMMSNNEMAMDLSVLMAFMKKDTKYAAMFAKAYPAQGINEITTGKALASFERTIISNNSAFDKWIKGDKNAMTKQQIRGFNLFSNPDKGNCEVCHSAPNFTDNGFNNIGLASFGSDNPDVGRYAKRPLKLMKGAFKTPTLRDITLSAPYFHDGSSSTLLEVVEHYRKGGVVKSNLSPNLKELKLSQVEVNDIVAFLETLTTAPEAFTLPIIPLMH
jgi:cytochrome c peroxidase